MVHIFINNRSCKRSKSKKEYKVDKTLYIVDKRQKLHFEQLFDSIKYFKFGEEEYTHVEFNTINDLNGI